MTASSDAPTLLDPLTPHEVATIAVDAHCDVKTLRSFLRDGPVRPSLKARIVGALRARGWLDRAKFGKATEAGSVG